MIEEDIKDIKDIIIAPDIIVYVFITILVIIAILILVFVIRKKKKSSIKKEEIILPPHIVALDKIKKLKDSGLIEQGRIKEFCIILSDIIRVFLEDKYKISALDRTTYELIIELKERNIAYAEISELENFLSDCDLVKFAKYIPSREELEKLLKQAEEIVEAKSNV